MTTGSRCSWFGLAVLLVVGACQGNQRTELVVEVDSNLAVPSQMDSVQVAVKGNTQPKSCSLINDCKLPWDVGIVEATAGVGTIEIVATGYLGTTPIVNQTAEVSFVEGKSMLLKLFLARECIGNTCDQNGQTCGNDGTCRTTARTPPGASGGGGSSGASNRDGSLDSGGSGDAWVPGDGWVPDAAAADAARDGRDVGATEVVATGGNGDAWVPDSPDGNGDGWVPDSPDGQPEVPVSGTDVGDTGLGGSGG